MVPIATVSHLPVTSLLVRDTAKRAKHLDRLTQLLQSLPLISQAGKRKWRVQFLPTDTGVERVAIRFLPKSGKTQNCSPNALSRSSHHFLPAQIQLANGKQMTVLVNERSFKQRYLKTPEERATFQQLLQEDRNAALNSFLAKKTSSTHSAHPSSTLTSNNVKEFFRNEPTYLTARDIENVTRVFNDSVTPDNLNKTEKNRVFSLGNRTVLISNGRTLGEGGFKRVSEGMLYQYNIKTGQIQTIAQCAVGISHLHKQTIKEAAERELTLLHQAKNKPELLQEIDSFYLTTPRGKEFQILVEELYPSSLEKLLTKKRTTEELLDLCLQLCQGVQTLHDFGFVHRDIKPENVLIDVHGSPVLADFGLACSVEDEELLKKRFGTPRFIPPEVRKKENPWSQKGDVWSLGIVLSMLRMRALEPPHNLCQAEKMRRQLDKSKSSLDRLIAQMLDPHPETRISLESLKSSLESLRSS